MRRPARTLLLVAGISLALLWTLRSGDSPPSRHSDLPADATTGVERIARSTTRPGQHLPMTAKAEDPEAFAGSLDGTDVAGALLIDEAGNFVPTADALALFEYFLSTKGEAPDEEILARIRAEITRRLDAPADAQATAFLDRYMTYRDRARAFGSGDSDDGDLRPRFERLRDLRREIFGDDTAANLFGEEEAAAEVAIAQREVAADPDLSDEEKAARIEELYGKLPEPLRKAREESMAAINLRADEARLRAEGAGPEQIRRLRVERFGEDAADRLEELDREDFEWDQRLRSFRQERARILSDRTLSPQQRDAAVSRLTAERFEERERIRVEALDQMAAE